VCFVIGGMLSSSQACLASSEGPFPILHSPLVPVTRCPLSTTSLPCCPFSVSVPILVTPSSPPPFVLRSRDGARGDLTHRTVLALATVTAVHTPRPPGGRVVVVVVVVVPDADAWLRCGSIPFHEHGNLCAERREHTHNSHDHTHWINSNCALLLFTGSGVYSTVRVQYKSIPLACPMTRLARSARISGGAGVSYSGS